MSQRGIMSVGENVKATMPPNIGTGRNNDPRPGNQGEMLLNDLGDLDSRANHLAGVVCGRFSGVCGAGDHPPEIRDTVEACSWSDHPNFLRNIRTNMDSIASALNALEDLVNRCELPD